jgi:hypothetical protein
MLMVEGNNKMVTIAGAMLSTMLERLLGLELIMVVKERTWQLMFCAGLFD